MRLKLVFDAMLDFEIEQNFTNPLFWWRFYLPSSPLKSFISHPHLNGLSHNGFAYIFHYIWCIVFPFLYPLVGVCWLGDWLVIDHWSRSIGKSYHMFLPKVEYWFHFDTSNYSFSLTNKRGLIRLVYIGKNLSRERKQQIIGNLAV